MKAITKNFLSFTVKVFISGILLAYLFRKIDWPKTFETLKNADMRYLAASFIVFLVVYLCLLLRWMFFIRSLDLNIQIPRVASSFFIGSFFNLFLPTSTGGDIMKAWCLFKDTPQRARVVASVVADRLWGFISIVVVAACSLYLGKQWLNDRPLLVAVQWLAGISLAMTWILFHEGPYAFCCRLFNSFGKLKDSLMRFHQAIVFLKNRRWALLQPVFISCISQTIFAFSFFLIARALGQDVKFIYFLMFIPLICVVSSLPSIGGLGFRDWGAAFLFAKVGMSTGTAVSMSLINFIFMVAVGLIGGACYVFTVSRGRVQCDPADSGF